VRRETEPKALQDCHMMDVNGCAAETKGVLFS
jgi:hypothetical protein